MTPIAQLLITLPMAATLGLVFGLSGCTLRCLPVLAPVFLGNGGGMGAAWRVIVPFALGRLCAYGGLGWAAGMAGRYLGEAPLGDGVHWLAGGAAIAVGAGLLLRARSPRCAATLAPLRPARALLPGGLFLSGVALALTPCAPLSAVLFSAAMVGSAAHGAALGVSFGAGAIVVPSLFFGVGVAYLGTRLRALLQAWRTPVEQLSAALLILLGASQLLA